MTYYCCWFDLPLSVYFLHMLPRTLVQVMIKVLKQGAEFEALGESKTAGDRYVQCVLSAFVCAEPPHLSTVVVHWDWHPEDIY